MIYIKYTYENVHNIVYLVFGLTAPRPDYRWLSLRFTNFDLNVTRSFRLRLGPEAW